MNATPGLEINDVRDPDFATVDDTRAQNALRHLCVCADGESDSVTISSAEAADIVAMLKSRAYLGHIATRLRMEEYFALP